MVHSKMSKFTQLFPAVDFPSVPDEKFRVQCTSDSGIFKLHLEARNSKQQWETVIGSNEDKINGIPKEVVAHAVKELFLRSIILFVTNYCLLERFGSSEWKEWHQRGCCTIKNRF